LTEKRDIDHYVVHLMCLINVLLHGAECASDTSLQKMVNNNIDACWVGLG